MASPWLDYAQLVERAGDIIYALDLEGRFVYYNASASRILGYDQQEMLGHHFTAILTPESARVAFEHFSHGVAGREATPLFSVEALCKGGGRIHLEIIASSLYRDGKLIGRQGIARDITEIKRLQGEVAEKSERVAILEERSRIARELHDNVAQKLFALGLELDWCAHNLTEGSPLHSRVRALKAMAEEGARELRRAIFNLSHQGPAAESLFEAIQVLVSRFEKASGIRCELAIRGERRKLPLATGGVVYSTIQECLLNVVKHARATQARVTLRFDGRSLSGEIRDNGCGRGSEVENTCKVEGYRFGLRNIIALIEKIGGILTILDNQPRGLKVSFRLPLPGERRR